MTGSDGRDASQAEGPGGFGGPGAGGSRGPASSTCEERAPCSPGTVDPRPPELRGHPCPWSRAAQRATAPCTAAGGTSTRPPTPRPEEDVSCQAPGPGGSASARGGPAWGFSMPPRRPLCPQEAAPGSGQMGGAGDLLTPPLPSAGRGWQRAHCHGSASFAKETYPAICSFCHFFPLGRPGVRLAWGPRLRLEWQRPGVRPTAAVGGRGVFRFTQSHCYSHQASAAARLQGHPAAHCFSRTWPAGRVLPRALPSPPGSSTVNHRPLASGAITEAQRPQGGLDPDPASPARRALLVLHAASSAVRRVI